MNLVARHARNPDGAGPEDSLSPAQQRTRQRARKAEERRLAEREQISGEIRTPAEITARRAHRANKPQAGGAAPAGRAPVSPRRLVPERTFSGRMIVLTVVTLVVISFLVPTVRTYLHQRAEVAELSEQITAEEERQAELYSTLQRWDDPEFVRQQARERINLVMPGERRYHIMGDLGEAEVENVADEVSEDETEWTESLWDSVVESAEE